MKLTTKKIIPPKSWQDESIHFKVAVEHPWYRGLMQLQDSFIRYTLDFYHKKGFCFAQLPITSGSISSPMGLGSDSSPVKVNISGIDTYLVDSMQFFLEYACRMAGKGVYYIAPSFRGEQADNRHLCQFYHSEAEIPGTLDDVIKLCEDYLYYLAKSFIESDKSIISQMAGGVDHIEEFMKNFQKVPRITFDQAVKVLENDSKFVVEKEGFRTINNQGEKVLMEKFGGWVWLTHFDQMAVPFYQKNDENNPERTLNADLLMGIGEMIGSGERHFSGNEVISALKRHNVDRRPYDWYIWLKDKFPMQTAGFGMGIERFFLWLLNHDDIRDMQILPRFNGVESTF